MSCRNESSSFLTNDFELPALTIAEPYRNRWNVELFFKWLKGHLKMKRFWGTIENKVRIQICCAIITYCLMMIFKRDIWLDRSVYEVLQITSTSLTDKTSLRDMFDKSNFNNFKEPDNLGESNLLNFNYPTFSGQ
jgi:IS4 transposase